jgi:hypothetical protein
MTEELALGLAAALAVVCVLFAARPFLRDPAAADDRLQELASGERDRLRREEERDRALAALKELEFDHRTGKVSDTDYRALVSELRRQAAEALRALDAGGPLERERTRVDAGADGKESEIEMPRRETNERAPGTWRAVQVERLESPLGPERVPEPWPPPDEGDLPGPPTPSPGEPTPGPEEPAPPEHPPMPQTSRREAS